jgi:hypothetical protein
MTCNVRKTVCMVFAPRDNRKIILNEFPAFQLNGSSLQFVQCFKYLGHLITHDLTDDDDIQREVRNMFYRTNMLLRKFKKCSVDVKLTLFRAYCISIYDAALWKRYGKTMLAKLRSCYHKCMKIFFGYNRRYSVTNMLFELGLPSFTTLLVNGSVTLDHAKRFCPNGLVQYLRILNY